MAQFSKSASMSDKCADAKFDSSIVYVAFDARPSLVQRWRKHAKSGGAEVNSY